MKKEYTNLKKRCKNSILKLLFVINLFLILFLLTCMPPNGGNDGDDADSITSSRVSNPTDGIQTGITANFSPESGNTWTFMIYLDADNNLETAGIDDFQEMIDGMNAANNDSNINLIVQMDRISGYSTSTAIDGADWEDTRRYQITSSEYTRLDTSPNLGELNMGDPQTLKNFINYCKTNFSADHYALILWNHGNGCRSACPSINGIATITKIISPDYSKTEKAICSDDTDNDILYLDELQDAVNDYFNAGNKLDLIGFDACLMATVEVAYEFSDLADYMAGSMASEWGYGWDYELIFKDMTTDVSTNPNASELAKLIVKTYRDSTISQSNQTQSAVDLSKLSALKTAVDTFGIALYDENKKTNIEDTRDLSYHFYGSDYESISWPYYDLSDFAYQIIGSAAPAYSANLTSKAQDVVDKLKDAVVAAYAGPSYGNYYGSGADVKRGLSIFFSRGNLDYMGSSHYHYQWWYTEMNTNTWRPGGHYYGLIDFCDSDADGIVETWRELMEYWYDNPDGYTPSSW